MTMPQRPIPVAADADPEDTQGHMPFKRGADAERAEGDNQDTEGHMPFRKADAERAEGDEDTQGHAMKARG